MLPINTDAPSREFQIVSPKIIDRTARVGEYDALFVERQALSADGHGAFRHTDPGAPPCGKCATWAELDRQIETLENPVLLRSLVCALERRRADLLATLEAIAKRPCSRLTASTIACPDALGDATHWCPSCTARSAVRRTTQESGSSAMVDFDTWHRPRCPEIVQHVSRTPCRGDYRWRIEIPGALEFQGFTCREAFARDHGFPIELTIAVPRTDLDAVLTQGIQVCPKEADRLRGLMRRPPAPLPARVTPPTEEAPNPRAR